MFPNARPKRFSAASLSTIVPVVILAHLLAPDAAAQRRRDLPRTQPGGELEVVATFDGPMPTGVTVSKDGRIFVNFPRWGDDVDYTVAEIVDGRTQAYPNAEINKLSRAKPAERFVSVQSVVVDPKNRLWVLDTGRVEWKPPIPGGPKLVGIDLEKNEVFRSIVLDGVTLPTTYLNDVRFDLDRGPEGLALVTDSSKEGPNGIIVVDLATGRAWRKLNAHPSVLAEKNFLPIVEGRPLLNRPEKGQPSPLSIGSDGIAISPDGQTLFYRPLAGRGLFSVPVEALADPETPADQTAAAVTAYGDLGFASDGLEMDQHGRLYLTNYEDNAILYGPAERLREQAFETLVYDERALWPDTLAVGPDGFLYFTANQLHRQKDFHNGEDMREKPYVLFRVRLPAADSQ